MVACEKNTINSDEDILQQALSNVEIEGRDWEEWEKNIVNPIIKLDDCDCPVAGTIELIKDGDIIAIIDFGNGLCDNLANKMVDDETYEFEMDCTKDNGDKEEDYIKNIINPIVELDNCDCPVAGTIEYIKDGNVIAVVDYGDGTCDNLATKTVDGVTSEYEMDCSK